MSRPSLKNAGGSPSPDLEPGHNRLRHYRSWAIALAVLAVCAYLIPGPPGYATALSFTAIVSEAETNGVIVTDDMSEALNRLALVFDSRTDLQTTFGRGSQLDGLGLVKWVRTYPDVSATPLRGFDAVYQTIEAQWSDPAPLGVGQPGVVPGLP